MAQNNVNPPHRVQAKFNAKYPEIAGKARWQQTDEGYRARFQQDKREVVSDYGPDGQWIQSRMQLREDELPPPARMYISDTYPTDYELLEASRIDTNQESRFEIDLRSEQQNYRLNFDREGVFIKEEPLEE